MSRQLKNTIPKKGRPENMGLFKYIWTIWFKGQCPLCMGMLYCRGGCAEVEICSRCGWKEI